MKYIVIIGDGMADYPHRELGNLTPLQYAKTPIWISWPREAKWVWSRPYQQDSPAVMWPTCQ